MTNALPTVALRQLLTVDFIVHYLMASRRLCVTGVVVMACTMPSRWSRGRVTRLESASCTLHGPRAYHVAVCDSDGSAYVMWSQNRNLTLVKQSAHGWKSLGRAGFNLAAAAA